MTRVRRLLVAAAERGEAGTALIERAKGEEEVTAPLDPQQLEKELLLAREAVNCKYLPYLIVKSPISDQRSVISDP